MYDRIFGIFWINYFLKCCIFKDRSIIMFYVKNDGFELYEWLSNDIFWQYALFMMLFSNGKVFGDKLTVFMFCNDLGSLSMQRNIQCK